MNTLDLSHLIDVSAALRVGGGWVYQGDGELKLARQAPPGETEEALALDYTFNAESQVHVAVNLPLCRFDTMPQSVALDVFGDESGNLLKLVFQDAPGGVYEYTAGRIDWTGWRTLTVPPPSDIRRFDFDCVTEPAPGWTQMLRQDEPAEAPAAPWRLQQIKLVWNLDRQITARRQQMGIPVEEVIRGAARVTAGRIFIRRLRADVVPDSLDGLTVELASTAVGHLVQEGTPAVIRLTATGSGLGDEAVNVQVQVTDYEGRQSQLAGPTLSLVRDTTATTDVPLSVLAPGWYEVTATIVAGSARRCARTQLGVVAPAATSAGTAPFFGMQAFDFAEAKRLGARIVRFGFSMADLNPAPGRFTLENYASIPRNLAQLGLTAMAQINTGAAWASAANGSPLWHQPRPDAFAEFVGALVSRYGNEVRDYEIWNEPNLDYFWSAPPDPVRYCAMLKAAYAAAKAANPGVRILGPALSGPTASRQKDEKKFGYLEAFFDAGGYDCLDVLSIHPYAWGGEIGGDDGLPETLDAVVEMMRRYGPVKPISLSEVGVQCPLTWGSVSLRRAAAFTASYLIHARAHPAVDQAIWYQLAGTVASQGQSAEDYDLVDPVTLAPRPAALAFHTVATVLGDLTTREALVRDAGTGMFVYRFATLAGNVLAAWSRTPGSRLELEGADDMERMDIMGRRSSQKDGWLALGVEPVLIRSAKSLTVRRHGVIGA